MSHLPQASTVQVEYNPRKRRISLDRIFQIPNMFRPAASAFFGNTLGRVNLERPAIGLTAVAGWFSFARWRQMHPVARPADHARRKDRTWLYERVIENEGLDSAPIDYWEFGVFRGESLFWWLDNLRNPESRFVGFDTFTGHDFSRRLVINLDADLYSSTLYVLSTLAPHFKRGDVIFFDNFICSLDEYRAFENFVRAFRVNYEVLGGVGEYMRVCVKIV